MGQSKKQSWFEAWTNVGVGMVINLTAQLFIFPMVGLSVTLTQNLGITGSFTVISVARSYVIRRFFNKR